MNSDPIFTSNKLPDGNTPGYPGGIFDPFGWSKGKDLATLKVGGRSRSRACTPVARVEVLFVCLGSVFWGPRLVVVVRTRQALCCLFRQG